VFRVVSAQCSVDYMQIMQRLKTITASNRTR